MSRLTVLLTLSLKRKGVRQVLDKRVLGNSLQVISERNRRSNGGAGRARTYDDRIMSSEAMTGSRPNYLGLRSHFQTT
jgi:hypothetical protein